MTKEYMKTLKPNFRVLENMPNFHEEITNVKLSVDNTSKGKWIHVLLRIFNTSIHKQLEIW